MTRSDEGKYRWPVRRMGSGREQVLLLAAPGRRMDFLSACRVDDAGGRVARVRERPSA